MVTLSEAVARLACGSAGAVVAMAFMDDGALGALAFWYANKA
jgi:hypothetical protein